MIGIVQEQTRPFMIRKVIITLPQPHEFYKIVGPVRNHPGIYYLITLGQHFESYLGVYSAQSPENPLLWSTNFSHSYCKQLGQDEFVAISRDEGTISLIYPLRKEREDYECNYAEKYPAIIELFTFKNSGLFCIAEQTSEGIKFSYFSVESLRSTQTPLNQLTINHFQFNIIQMNEDSELGAKYYRFQIKAMKFFYLRFCDQKKQIQDVKVEITKLKDLEDKIEEIKKLEPKITDEFRWKMVLKISPFEYLIEIKNREKGNIKFPMLIDTSQSQSMAVLKQLRITYNKEPYLLCYRDRVKYYVLHSFLMIKIYSKQKKKSYKLLYVNKITKQIEILEEYSSQQRVFSIRGTITVEMMTHMSTTTQLVMKDWQVNPKQAFLFFLLHLYEDFDDDLLQDCIESMECEQLK